MDSLIVNKKSSTSFTKEHIKEHIYKTLKKNIIEIELRPGESITEKGIAEIFGVSRTPVREAFIKLTQEGLLEVYPQRGTRVSLIDLDRVEEARFARENLERAVIKLACQDFPSNLLFELRSNLNAQEFCAKEKNYLRLFYLDEDFHHIIFEGCNKGRLWLLINQISLDFNRTRILKLSSNFSLDKIIFQHHKIVEAIAEKEPIKGEKIIKEHLNKVDIDFSRLKLSYPCYFKNSDEL